MFVERLLAAAHKRLITISADASFLEAARFLGSGTDLVVVCNSDDTIVGVITKTTACSHLNFFCEQAFCSS